jgi:uncharacterized protein
MRTLLAVILFFTSNVLPAQQSRSFIKDLPNRAHVVNDFGGFLLTGDEKTLEDDLIFYRKKTGNAIVIITLSTLTDETGHTWSVEDAALEYFNKWGIGDRYRNNGVLILISKDPRRVRITTGTGVEDILTDDVCQQIIDNAIVPNFKLSFYYKGLKEGIKDIKAALNGGKYSARVYTGSAQQSGTGTQAAADNWSSDNKPPQTQAQPQAQTQQQQPVAQNVAAKPKISPARQALRNVVSFLIIVLIIWLRVKWVTGEKFFGAKNAEETTGRKATFRDYLNATGWFFLWFAKIIWWMIVFSFGIFAIFFGYNVWKRNAFSFGSRSSGARGSYGGGRSDGGGATGSW